MKKCIDIFNKLPYNETRKKRLYAVFSIISEGIQDEA